MNLGGEAGGDILPLLMNMQKPPKIDPVTGALIPHEQGPRSKIHFFCLSFGQNTCIISTSKKDPNEMMMMMALTGQNPAMMGGMPPQAMMGR